MKPSIRIQSNKSYSGIAEIEAAINEALVYNKVVSRDQLPDYYQSTDEIAQNTTVIYDEQLSVWDEEHSGEALYHVTIYEHYIGGPDWTNIYTYTID